MEKTKYYNNQLVKILKKTTDQFYLVQLIIENEQEYYRDADYYDKPYIFWVDKDYLHDFSLEKQILEKKEKLLNDLTSLEKQKISLSQEVELLETAVRRKESVIAIQEKLIEELKKKLTLTTNNK